MRHLETERLVDQHHSDPSRSDLTVDDDNLVHGAAYAIRSLGAGVFEPIRVLVDAEETFLDVADDLLSPDDENDSSGAADIRPELAAAHRSREQRPGFSDRVDAPEHDIGRRAQAAYGIHSAVNKVLIINGEIIPERITVVLVDEVLGF